MAAPCQHHICLLLWIIVRFGGPKCVCLLDSLFPLFPMRRSLWNCYCFISVTSTYSNMSSLSYAAPLPWLCLLHYTINIFLWNIYWWHVLPSFGFFLNILYHYSEMCVLDPAVAHCSSCTSGIKPLSYNTPRANKWKAVSGSDSLKVEFQHSHILHA